MQSTQATGSCFWNHCSPARIEMGKKVAITLIVLSTVVALGCLLVAVIGDGSTLEAMNLTSSDLYTVLAVNVCITIGSSIALYLLIRRTKQQKETAPAEIKGGVVLRQRREKIESESEPEKLTSPSRQEVEKEDRLEFRKRWAKADEARREERKKKVRISKSHSGHKPIKEDPSNRKGEKEERVVRQKKAFESFQGLGELSAQFIEKNIGTQKVIGYLQLAAYGFDIDRDLQPGELIYWIYDNPDYKIMAFAIRLQTGEIELRYCRLGDFRTAGKIIHDPRYEGFLPYKDVREAVGPFNDLICKELANNQYCCYPLDVILHDNPRKIYVLAWKKNDRQGFKCFYNKDLCDAYALQRFKDCKPVEFGNIIPNWDSIEEYPPRIQAMTIGPFLSKPIKRKQDEQRTDEVDEVKEAARKAEHDERRKKRLEDAQKSYDQGTLGGAPGKSENRKKAERTIRSSKTPKKEVLESKDRLKGFENARHWDT